MLNVERMTDRSEEDLIQLLKSHFGPGGLGLDMTSDSESGGNACLTFEGGGGFIKATVSPAAGRTRLDLMTREWEAAVEEFLTKKV